MGATTRNTVVIAAIITSLTTATITLWLLRTKTEYCTTKRCIDAASRILNTMDETVDPCNEFYQYACGGWVKNNPIPADKGKVSQFDLVEDRMSRDLRETLSANYTNDRPAIRKAKILYKACMDESAIERLEAMPALDMIEKLGGFPLFGSETDELFELESYLATTKTKPDDIYSSSSAPFIVMSVTADDKNSSVHVILVDQPYLILPDRDYYLDDALKNSTIPAYRKYLQDYLAELWKSKDKDSMSATYDEEKLKEAIDEVIQLETDLATISLPISERMDPSEMYMKFTLEELSTNVSSAFDWFKFVSEIMGKINYKVDPQTEIVSFGTPYFLKFMDVLKKYDNSVLRNYVIISSLSDSINYLSKKFRNTAAPLRKSLSGNDVERKRFYTCNDVVNSLLPMPVGSLYVQSFFSVESKQVVLDMKDDIIQAFKNNLGPLQWMDNETKKAASTKADAVMDIIGYPDYIVDENDPKLDEETSGFDPKEDAYFEGVTDLLSWNLKTVLEKIRKPVLRNEFEIGPAVYNAYYDPNRNSMVLPAAGIQAPDYDTGHPFAMNYAGVGSAIGHELTHGFDDWGSQYNEIGNLENWWTNFSRSNFNDKAECIKKQYSGFYYKPAEMNINGELTIGENIADIGGIRQCYDGYQIWRKENKEREFRLPGFEDFTPEQMFFLGHAQVWCAAERPESAKRSILTDYHSPNPFRVDGAFMNYDKFGEAYKCKQGVDRMYPKPEDTCRVW